MSTIATHPLDILTVEEVNTARKLILSLHPGKIVYFRETYLSEPLKKELIPFLTAEHEKVSPLPSFKRRALVQYDVLDGDQVPVYQESILDLDLRKRISHVEIAKEYHAALETFVGSINIPVLEEFANYFVP